MYGLQVVHDCMYANNVLYDSDMTVVYDFITTI